VDAGHTLGIWDGHDAGAALLEGGRVVAAVNEERLTRRKLDVGFPARSIEACLAFAGLSPKDVTRIAACTSDPAKTLTRLVPGLKEEYYLIRRRKKRPGRLDPLKKRFKYRFTELPPNRLTHALSRTHLYRALRAAGFDRFRLSLVDHHEAHARAAALLSGFDECLVLTLDGLGDGLCGSVWRYEGRRLARVAALPADASLGIFFEHVTNLMNMRELEDEGKVMALANYAYPVPDAENPLLDLMGVHGLRIVTPFSANRLHAELRKILWQYPSEQFAFMAQRALERNVLQLVRNALSETGLSCVAAAGGLFSNIKVNKRLQEMDEVSRLYVFPHMGDGGLALGAALNPALLKSQRLEHLYLGPRAAEAEIESAVKRFGLPFRRVEDPAGEAARRMLAGEIILWHQGRMEYGPRALGNRSILARPDDRAIKDRLNLALKKRVWYQPFCPSMLGEDAEALLELPAGALEDTPFMTSSFRVRPEHLERMAGVTNIDGTCRPHFVGTENPRFRALLERVKESLGHGVVLNTSFNIHGDPMVCTPEDALSTLERTGVRSLFLEDMVVENPRAQAL